MYITTEGRGVLGIQDDGSGDEQGLATRHTPKLYYNPNRSPFNIPFKTINRCLSIFSYLTYTLSLSVCLIVQASSFFSQKYYNNFGQQKRIGFRRIVYDSTFFSPSLSLSIALFLFLSHSLSFAFLWC